MYTVINFKSKKSLREAIAKGEKIRIYQPNDMFSNPKALPTYSGKASVEGPHYPEPHRWYAEVELVEGIIVKVK